jgi:hypothetical protein
MRRALRCIALLYASVLTGCGSNTDGVPVGESSSLSTADDVRGGTARAPRPTLFAATVGDCSHHVTLNGNPGTVVAHARVTTLFWGGYWSGTGASERTGYDQTWNDIGNNAAFYARLAEYSTTAQTIGAGSWTGSVLANGALASGATVTEAQIQAELSAEIGAGTAPAITADSIYVIMIPPGVTSQLDQQNNFAGHHSQFGDAKRGTLPIRYAVITYSSDPTYTNPVISHELSETISDPDLSTGWWDTGDGQEIGDICRFNYVTLDGFQIEKIWSQKQCACIGAPPSADVCTAPPWNATQAYPGGSIVSFNNSEFKAAFWNQNAEPDTHNGPAGSGQPWNPPTTCQGTTTCQPSCSGKQCGDNGCGGSCGTCASDQTCSTSNQCVPTCAPACSGKQCGDDGCGGSCGSCTSGQTCDANGLCQSPTTSGNCGRIAPWDPAKPWYYYTVGEQHVGSNNHRYSCRNVAYCIDDPTSAVGATYGWTDLGPC